MSPDIVTFKAPPKVIDSLLAGLFTTGLRERNYAETCTFSLVKKSFNLVKFEGQLSESGLTITRAEVPLASRDVSYLIHGVCVWGDLKHGIASQVNIKGVPEKTPVSYNQLRDKYQGSPFEIIYTVDGVMVDSRQLPCTVYSLSHHIRQLAVVLQVNEAFNKASYLTPPDSDCVPDYHSDLSPIEHPVQKSQSVTDVKAEQEVPPESTPVTKESTPTSRLTSLIGSTANTSITYGILQDSITDTPHIEIRDGCITINDESGYKWRTALQILTKEYGCRICTITSSAPYKMVYSHGGNTYELVLRDTNANLYGGPVVFTIHGVEINIDFGSTPNESFEKLAFLMYTVLLLLIMSNNLHL